jgi:hypothetical protein
MTDSILPDGFLRLSDATSRLAEGMWGGLSRPDPLAPIKRIHKRPYKNLSIGWGPWRERAGRRLRAAAVKGTLVVYVLANLGALLEKEANILRFPEQLEPMVVPVMVLKRLIATARGSLPDHPIALSIKTTGGNERLFELLLDGLLAIRESDFTKWYRSERAKGNWPSQRSRLKTRTGRPTKQTKAIRQSVLTLVHREQWSGKDGIAKLHPLLTSG